MILGTSEIVVPIALIAFFLALTLRIKRDD